MSTVTITWFEIQTQKINKNICSSYIHLKLVQCRWILQVSDAIYKSINNHVSVFLYTWVRESWIEFNPLTPNDLYMSRTAPLTSKRCILYIYSTNVVTEYFKHFKLSFFSLQNAICFIMLTSLVPVLFTFYIQNVLKLKKNNNNSGSKGLNIHSVQLSVYCLYSCVTPCWWSQKQPKHVGK